MHLQKQCLGRKQVLFEIYFLQKKCLNGDIDGIKFKILLYKTMS